MFKGLCNFATVKITEKIKSWLSKSNNLWSNLMFLKGNSTGKRLSKGWKRKQKLKHPIVYSFFHWGLRLKEISCTLVLLREREEVLQRKGSDFQTVEATSMTNLLPPTSMTKVLPFPCKTMSKHVPFFLLIYDQRIQYFLQHSQYF